MSILPKTAYQQGIPREFLKFDKYDEFLPQLELIGEQPIYKEEVYVDTVDPGGTFGYTPRYAEYKHMFSRTAGDFRDSLSYWTMTRRFATEPQLNAQFVEANPTEDIFAVTDPEVDKIYAHVLHRIKANRPMAYFGTPTI